VDTPFQLLSELENQTTIAVGNAIREIKRIRKFYGKGRWRKLKGIATLSLKDGIIKRAEVHWYEAHGIGRKELKIKRFI
jgi:hypothetical protein